MQVIQNVNECEIVWYNLVVASLNERVEYVSICWINWPDICVHVVCIAFHEWLNAKSSMCQLPSCSWNDHVAIVPYLYTWLLVSLSIDFEIQCVTSLMILITVLRSNGLSSNHMWQVEHWTIYFIRITFEQGNLEKQSSLQTWKKRPYLNKKKSSSINMYIDKVPGHHLFWCNKIHHSIKMNE